MANMGQLVRRQSSRELRPQKSIEMCEFRSRLLSADQAQAKSAKNRYGTVNTAFADDTAILYRQKDGSGPESSEKGVLNKEALLKGKMGASGEKGLDDDLSPEPKVPSVKKKTVQIAPGAPEESAGDPVFTEEEGEGRDSWDSKLTFLLATIGYAVGLGNVWRFPYLAQKNGGGAFLIPYFIMLSIEGLPIFFLELAIGQRLRKGAIGVWSQVSPYLAGVGIASAVVSFNVALYYNTIISWCLLYFVKSFQDPLPWSDCPMTGNGTNLECQLAGPTSYFWYRNTLQISKDIETPETFNLQIAAALFVAWVLIYLCLAKGIASSPYIVYVTAIFPYVVLIMFFCRGVTLEGMSDGIKHLFTPKWEKLLDPVVWLEAGTQIFFSLGLGFGGLIAFASYNPVNNNCMRDAFIVSITNCTTSLFAGIVIFSVIGFKAHILHKECLKDQDNATLLQLFGTTHLDTAPPPVGSPVTYPGPNGPVTIPMPDVRYCLLQDELDRTASGPGLAFIIFTEAINQFAFAPFWSILFFSMLFTLGIDSQFGTLEGVISSLVDMKILTNIRKEIITGILCTLCALLSMMFAHGAGNYIFILFDSFAGNVPLLIIAFFECVGVAYIYGLRNFADDIELMTGSRPGLYWLLCWKYISPIVMMIILTASWIKIFTEGSTYPRWDKEHAVAIDTEWPNWALGMAVFLVLIAVIWIPVVAFGRMAGLFKSNKEEPAWFPSDDLRDFHGIVAHEPTPVERVLFGFREDGSEGVLFPTKHGQVDEDEENGDLR